jgi:hypothetical protein
VTTLRHQMANGQGCAIPSPTHTRPKRCRGALDDRVLAMVVVVGRPLCLGIRLTHVYEVELGATLRAKARNHVVRHGARTTRHCRPSMVGRGGWTESGSSEARSWGPPLSRVARAHARGNVMAAAALVNSTEFKRWATHPGCGRVLFVPDVP